MIRLEVLSFLVNVNSGIHPMKVCKRKIPLVLYSYFQILAEIRALLEKLEENADMPVANPD